MESKHPKFTPPKRDDEHLRLVHVGFPPPPHPEGIERLISLFGKFTIRSPSYASVSSSSGHASPPGISIFSEKSRLIPGGGINISVKCPRVEAILKVNSPPPGLSRHCVPHIDMFLWRMFQSRYQSNAYCEKHKENSRF